MRHSIKQFVKVCSETLPIAEPIYEFGSVQVPGQEGLADLRPLFPGKRYVGADLSKGLGVDIILDLHDIDLPSNSVGTVISCDTFEHVKYPYRAITELHRILKPNGILIISSVMDWPIHGYPNDYWRFTPEGFKSLLSIFPSAYVDWNGKEEKPHTVVGVAVKGNYEFKPLDSRRNDWRSVNDFPLSGKLLSPVVKTKKFVERMIFPPRITIEDDGNNVPEERFCYPYCARFETASCPYPGMGMLVIHCESYKERR